MTLEQWQSVGTICGAILALAGVVLLVGKGLSMLWDWRFGRDIKASQIRGETALERIEAVLADVKDEQDRQAAWQAEHSRLHGSNGGPAAMLPQSGRRARRA